MVQEWDRRIGAYLQFTTVHHPATPTVENLVMTAWVQEWDRRIGAHLQCTTVHHPATPTVENLGMAAWVQEWDRRIRAHLQPHLQLGIWGWLHGSRSGIE
jgi:hypothetical protein